MPKSTEEIVALYSERKKRLDPIRKKALEVKATYEGEIVVPLPEMDRTEQVAVANLLQQGLDHMGMRVSSVQPDVHWPELRTGIERSRDRSRERRLVNLGWWRANRMPIIDAKRGRYFVGYATSPVMVRPNFRTKIPDWQIRDPLTTFPPPESQPDDIHPDDCIFVVQQSLAWLKINYPAQFERIEKGRVDNLDSMIDVLEYADAEEIVSVVLGRDAAAYIAEGTKFEELERIPNRANMPLAVIPGRITLDKPMGQYDGLVGIYQMQAKMFALETIGVTRGIFPETWWYSADPGRQPKIITRADGRTGDVGIVTGGQPYVQQVNPTYLAGPTMDRMEYAMRQSGVPAEFGGTGASNVRTGRRGEQLMGAAVDPWVAEAQMMLAASKEQENKIAAAIEKAYWGSASKSIFIGSRGGKKDKTVKYVPNEVFETDENEVVYGFAGSDVNTLVIAGQSLVGSGIMSKRRLRRVLPSDWVDDPEEEERQVEREAIDAAGLQAVQAQAASGEIPAIDIAEIKRLHAGGMSWEDAVTEAQKRAQERQAAQAPAGAPELQPGLAMPGMGVEANPGIPGPEPSAENLSKMLFALRAPARATKELNRAP